MIKIKTKKRNYNFLGNTDRGFSLVEMLVYMATLVLILIVVISTLVFVMNSLKEVQASQTIESSAIFALERISREIRSARQVDFSNPDILALQSKDDEALEFLLENGVVTMTENGVSKGSLTKSEARVTDLKFFLSEDGPAQVIRVVMTIEAGEGDNFKERTFYNSTALR